MRTSCFEPAPPGKKFGGVCWGVAGNGHRNAGLIRQPQKRFARLPDESGVPRSERPRVLGGSPDLMPQDARSARINALIILIAFTPGSIRILSSIHQNKL
jgi:hypothetical protein